MTETVKQKIKKLTELTLYHSAEIVKTELELESLIHNNPNYADILELTKEMNNIATAVNTLDITARMVAGLRYEDKQRQLKELYNKL